MLSFVCPLTDKVNAMNSIVEKDWGSWNGPMALRAFKP